MGPDVDVSATKPVVGLLCQECFVLFIESVMGGVLDAFAPVEDAQVEDVGLELAEF